ncbi:MAG: cache domain-containing protein, partial [Cyanobacteria bacterium J06639_1]
AFLFHTTDKDGENISRSDDGELRFYGDREYFQQAKEGGDIGRQVLISRTTGKPALCMSAPIEQNAAFVGALTGCSSLETISDLVVNTEIGETGFAFLIDRQGRVIAHGRPDLISEELQNFSDNPAISAGILDRPFEFQDNGRTVLAYAETTDLGWTLVVQQDASEALAPARESVRNSVIAVVVTLGVTFGLAYVFAGQLARPIRSLTEVADAVSRGQLDVAIKGTGRQDEIGALARSVKRLATSVKVSFEQLKRQSRS